MNIAVKSGFANSWLAEGVHVFPCDHNKKSLVKWRDADSDVLLNAWQRHPDAMAGLSCGCAGIVVIDCDKRADKDGVAAFIKLCADLRVSLDTVPYVNTPSGGVHYYFKAPAGVKLGNGTGALPSGIDIRGDGGYAIAPGSIRADGRRYEASLPLGMFIAKIGSRDLPELPAALVRVIQKDRAPSNVVPFEFLSAAPMSAIFRNAMEGADKLGTGISKGPFDGLTSQGKSAVLADWLGKLNNTQDDPREWWLKVIFACADAERLGCADACALALAWSRKGKGWTGETEFKAAYDSFKPGKITVGTLAHMAKQAAIAAGDAGYDPWAVVQVAGAPPVISSATGIMAYGTASADWDLTDRKKIARSFHNAGLALQKLGVAVRYNIFANQHYIGNRPGSGALEQRLCGTLSDDAIDYLRGECQRCFHFDPGKQNLFDAALTAGQRNPFNPVVDWLNGLVWDGTKRLSRWLPAVTGAPDTELNRRAGAVLIMAMVARAYHPGSKFDLCLVLEGGQGIGKSRLARALPAGAGDTLFSDVPSLLTLGMKERAELLSGRWVVELGELSGMARADNESTKAFISQSTDSFRAAYARVAKDHPRTCVFLASTNDREYLQDGTGNRRFLPIECGSRIDVGGFANIRAQIFAEAYHILREVVRHAPLKGWVIVRDKPLPDDFMRVIGIPERLWSEAADIAETRRVIADVELYLPDAITSLEAGMVALPDGRKFVSSTDLQDRLRMRLSRVIYPRAVGAAMHRLGWADERLRIDGKRPRGFAK